MPRWEILVQLPIEDDGINWEGMGMDVPAARQMFRRRYIDTCDIQWLQERDEQTTHCKLSYEEMPLVIEGNYDDLCITLDDIENDGMEWEFDMEEDETVDEGEGVEEED